MNTKKLLAVAVAAAAVGVTGPVTAAAGEDRHEDKDKAAEQYQHSEGDKDYAYSQDKKYDHASDKQQQSQAGQYGEGDDMQKQSRTGYSQGDQSEALISSQMQSENDIGEFATALNKAGLANALDSRQHYTVFAPTDEAFDALEGNKAETLMKDENVDQLRETLRSHIVVGEVDADRAKSLDDAKVMTGKTVTLETKNGKLHVGDATVVKSDLRAGNLTIHTIDQVLTPETLSAEAEEGE